MNIFQLSVARARYLTYTLIQWMKVMLMKRLKVQRSLLKYFLYVSLISFLLLLLLLLLLLALGAAVSIPSEAN